MSAAAKIVIEADRELVPLLPQYLKGRAQDLIDMKKAFEQKNFESIRGTSHIVRGHGASYGFKGLTEICKKLEEAATHREVEKVALFITEYEIYLASVELPS